MKNREFIQSIEKCWPSDPTEKTIYDFVWEYYDIVDEVDRLKNLLFESNHIIQELIEKQYGDLIFKVIIDRQRLIESLNYDKPLRLSESDK